MVLPQRRTDCVIDGTNADHLARRVAVKSLQPRSGAPQAQDLTVIRVAKVQLAVPSGEPLPTDTRRMTHSFR